MPGFDELNEVFNIPADQQTLFPLRTELAGGLETAGISRVKALRKNAISTSCFPHPLKDDKLLLDAKIKWPSRSNVWVSELPAQQPAKAPLLIWKVFIRVLEVRNDGVAPSSCLP